MIMFLSKESTTNLLLANICFSNLLIAFLVKVDHHVLLSFIGQFYQVSLVIVIVFQGESRYHHLIPANLCDLCQLCSFNWRVASKILMMMLLTPDWRGCSKGCLEYFQKSSTSSLNSIPPGGLGILLPLYSHISHLLTCLPILHRRYIYISCICI